MTLTLVFDAGGLLRVEITTSDAEERTRAHALWRSIEPAVRELGQAVAAALADLRDTDTYEETHEM